MDLLKIISDIKTSKLFREIVFVFGGFGFIVLVWFFWLQSFKFDLLINRLELDIFFLVSSYLVGRIVFSFASILDVVGFLLSYLGLPRPQPKIIKNSIREFVAYKTIHSRPIYAEEIEQTITAGDIWSAISRFPLFEEAFERDLQSMMFKKFFFIYSILCLLYFNFPWAKLIFTIVLVFFFVSWYFLNRRIFIGWIDLQKHIVKEGNKKPREKEPVS